MSPTHVQSLVRLILLSFLFPQAWSAPAVAARAAGPSVTLASGVLVGTTIKLANQPQVTAEANAYLGVPFAKSPPVRFSPPEAALPWSTPLQAQVVKPACIQQFSGSGTSQAAAKELFGNPLGSPPEESEDCLYLNVYSPPGVTPTSKKAVMFWIYGGNLQFGTGGLRFYDGSSLALNQDVIVVTINYRTNMFGFPNSPENPPGSQNPGYLDQRFALKWVQDNIANFGGDPARVLLFGESAGGESVKQLLANPPKPLPFSAAVLQSQNAVVNGNGLINYEQVKLRFKCKDIACLRDVPAVEIKAYIESQSLGFPPVNGDGTAVSDVKASITTRKWANVPAMLGSNLNEARVFLAVFGLNNGTTALDGLFDLLNITSRAVRDSIGAAYAAKGITNVVDVVDRIGTDLIFTCTTSSLANYLALNGYTTYRYRYDGIFPTVSTFANAGAYHTAEIPSVFGTYPLSNQFGTATPEQIQLSNLMQNKWANLAKNPGGGVGWPKVLSVGDELGVFGYNGTSGVTVRSKSESDHPCLLYATIEDLLGLSY